MSKLKPEHLALIKKMVNDILDGYTLEQSLALCKERLIDDYKTHHTELDAILINIYNRASFKAAYKMYEMFKTGSLNIIPKSTNDPALKRLDQKNILFEKNTLRTKNKQCPTNKYNKAHSQIKTISKVLQDITG